MCDETKRVMLEQKINFKIKTKTKNIQNKKSKKIKNIRVIHRSEAYEKVYEEKGAINTV